MNFTKALFKFSEILNGSKISGHYNKIKNHFELKNEDCNSALNHLLRHSVHNVPHYNAIDFKSLNNFSIINKTIIKSNFHEFRALNYTDKGLTKMTTSGSTGTPFTVFQDKNKKHRNYADTLYFGNKAGYELGNKLMYLKMWVKEKMPPQWELKLRNISPIDVLNFNNDKIAHLIDGFKENEDKTHNLLGYVSALEQIVKYCETNNIEDLDCKFSGIITISETLSDVTRQKLQKLFKCHVFSRYSNLENGIIAQQEADSSYFRVNTASYIVEIFHLDKDELLENGAFGRIVLTDLYNYAMPMIRYDTGDMGIKLLKDGETYLKTIEGRKLDLIYNTSGDLLNSNLVAKNMWQYIEIEQYQLIQIGEKSYQFKINCPTGFKKELQLIKEFKSYLGEDAIFDIVYVHGIPLLNSGKHRKTVNLYKNN